jgi:hypothetical protein
MKRQKDGAVVGLAKLVLVLVMLVFFGYGLAERGARPQSLAGIQPPRTLQK